MADQTMSKSETGRTGPPATAHPVTLRCTGSITLNGTTHGIEIQINESAAASPPPNSTPVEPPQNGQATGSWTVTGLNSDGTNFSYSALSNGVRVDQLS